ncbi:MAG: mandelate racemase, partial [Candidatus Eremiobacteraeota bacterium]|nr:mandelate racemase [Candidatus Eremiobacteraeota bacterium]
RAYALGYDGLGQRLLHEVLTDAAAFVPGLPLDPVALGAALDRRYRLVGARGVIGMALASVDVALWDALAQAAGVPLARHLGGDVVPLRAYNSNGLGLIGPAAAATEAVELVAEGYRTIKLRLGYPTLAEDLAALRAVRTAVGPEIEILSDYNQMLSADEALRRCPALDEFGLGWIEEPIVHDDYAACARLAQATATPIQIGENFLGPHALRAALAARASDLVMFDAQRIEGVSGWMAAAALAADAAIPVSSHLLPEVSAHLLAATPTRDRLEMVDWANPVLVAPLTVRDGLVTPPDEPGTGVRWDEAAVARYRV